MDYPPPSHFEYCLVDDGSQKFFQRTRAQRAESSTFPFAPSPSDLFLFGEVWEDVQTLVENGEIFSLIAKRREEIQAQKEHWRPFITQSINVLPFYSSFAHVIHQGHLIPLEEGFGAAYLLIDKRQHPQYIIKPVDEDILCLNNYKYFASPFNNDSVRAREFIPLYRSSQTDCLASEIAILLGIPYITPETVMHIVKNDTFYDITESLETTDSFSLIPCCGNIDKEKLCSIQYFLPNSYEFYDVLKEWDEQNLPLETIRSMLDQDDFEDMCFFIWTIYDTDAHSGNIRLYVKDTAPDGHIIYGLRKIDNNLSLPEKNRSLLNCLAYLPNARSPLSPRIQKLIAEIPISQILDRFYLYEMENCIPAFQERVAALQALATRKDLTIADINERLSLLSCRSP